MRVQCIGVKRISGPKGKNSGKPYDFAQLTILKPIEVVASESFQLQGYGYETSDLDLDNEALPQFAQVKFPANLELIVDTKPGRSGLRSLIVGVKAA